MNKDFFTSLENRSPYLKAAFQGAAGTGKSYTLLMLVVGLHKHIKSDKPIVFIDTEQSSKFFIPMLDDAGIEVLLKESRTLPDLMTAIKFCHEGGSDIVIIDSITHIYEKFVKDYQQNKPRNKGFLTIRDWGVIKTTWRREFVDWYTNSRVHAFFTGREGFSYDQQENSETGKKEFVKSGYKMSAEKDTPFEPDVLVRMSCVQSLDEGKIHREGTVLKDKSTLIDGKTFKNPTFEDFKPVVDFLLRNPKPANENKETQPNTDLIEEEIDTREHDRERKVLLEEKDAMLDKVAAGTTGDAKKLKLALTEYAFHGETSETKIACMTKDELTEGTGRLAPLCKAVYTVQRWEPHVYPVAKAVNSARMKYLENVNLGESTIEKLDAYSAHMKVKYDESQKKGEE